jgi:hypothetical protein
MTRSKSRCGDRSRAWGLRNLRVELHPARTLPAAIPG